MFIPIRYNKNLVEKYKKPDFPIAQYDVVFLGPDGCFTDRDRYLVFGIILNIRAKFFNVVIDPDVVFEADIPLGFYQHDIYDTYRDFCCLDIGGKSGSMYVDRSSSSSDNIRVINGHKDPKKCIGIFTDWRRRS